MGIISGSVWGSFQGWGSFRGRDHFGGCTEPSMNLGVHAIPDTLFLAQEPYRAGLLFTDNNGDFGAISVTV